MKICGWRGRDGRQNLYGHVDFYDDDDEDDEISIDLCMCGVAAYCSPILLENLWFLKSISEGTSFTMSKVNMLKCHPYQVDSVYFFYPCNTP